MWLIAGDSSIRVWDARTWRPRTAFTNGLLLNPPFKTDLSLLAFGRSKMTGAEITCIYFNQYLPPLVPVVASVLTSSS